MATTKEDLVSGLRNVKREGDRVMSGFGPDDWKKKALDADEDGWTRRDVYCHLASLAEIAPGFVGGLANSGGKDAAAGLDINALNAQLVAGKAQLSEPQLIDAFKAGYEKLIAFVGGLPEEQLNAPAKFGQLEGQVSELMDSVLVLHPMAHIYGAGGSPLG
jgi:hypothetical protein